MEDRTTGTIEEFTRVSLFDCAGYFICAWLGYRLPDFLGIELNNDQKWPNKNATLAYKLKWFYQGEPREWHVESLGMPLGMGIQTELAVLARI